VGLGRRSLADIPIGQNAAALKALDVTPDLTGYGIFMATGPDEFLMAGDNVLITFSTDPPERSSWPWPGRQEGRLRTANGWSHGIWVATTRRCGATSPTPSP